MLVTLEVLGESSVVRIAQRELEVRDVSHEDSPQHEVPFVQLERAIDVAVAKIKVRREP